jgi:predicted dehydrogenase
VSLTRSLPEWFYDREKSGGGLVDQATHNFDLLRYLFGEVREIHGAAINPFKKKVPGYTIDEVISLSLVFEKGLVCSHTHTWVGDRWRNEIGLSGAKRFYRLLLWNGQLIVENGKKQRALPANEKPLYEYENKVFLDMVKSGDWGRNPCDYADGVKTLELTLACVKASEGERVML